MGHEYVVGFISAGITSGQTGLKLQLLTYPSTNCILRITESSIMDML